MNIIEYYRGPVYLFVDVLVISASRLTGCALLRAHDHGGHGGSGQKRKSSNKIRASLSGLLLYFLHNKLLYCNTFPLAQSLLSESISTYSSDTIYNRNLKELPGTLYSTMMKLIAFLHVALLLPAMIVDAQVSSKIESLQDTEPDILASAAIVFNVNAYQTQARNSASAVLINNPSDAQIRNYYALACIYYATNGVPNPRTNELIPGATIPKWETDDWINTEDYCTWFGVTCDSSGEVVGLDLHENSVFGIFPNEVVLLKGSLQLMELYNNAFLYSVAPKWLSGMSVLKYLYIGSTSFTHDGIPADLSGAKSLSKYGIVGSDRTVR